MKAIFELGNTGRTVGVFGLGARGDGIGSVAQQTSDGDTVNVRALGNFGVRFLGIDTPESSFRLPGSAAFSSTGSEGWQEFLNDPFAAQWGDIELTGPLRASLEERTGTGCAENHKLHASRAEDSLEAMISSDLQVMGWTKETAEFFLSFAVEALDGYGRLLAYINRNQRSATVPEPRPKSYNERQLVQGSALPYFIWPNVNPFRRQSSLLDAVLAPGTAADVGEAESALRDARSAVRSARSNQIGVFDAGDPLRIEAFELRFLAGRRAPGRWVIDLSQNDDRLLGPQRYLEIPNAEDRLFVSSQHVPLFEMRGWRRDP